MVKNFFFENPNTPSWSAWLTLSEPRVYLWSPKKSKKKLSWNDPLCIQNMCVCLPKVFDWIVTLTTKQVQVFEKSLGIGLTTISQLGNVSALRGLHFGFRTEELTYTKKNKNKSKQSNDILNSRVHICIRITHTPDNRFYWVTGQISTVMLSRLEQLSCLFWSTGGFLGK